MAKEADQASVTPAAGHAALARKYRPKLFSELIGQDAMVRTLRNAFASGRIAQAYMLTGVRGVGKTTTARLIARALNYVPPGGDGGAQPAMGEIGLGDDHEPGGVPVEPVHDAGTPGHAAPQVRAPSDKGVH